MKIGLDARFYGPRQKGLGRYVERLIENLEKIDKKNQYLVFLRKENFDEYQPQNPNFKKVLANYRWYGFREQIFLPFKILNSQVDLIHFPHFNVPLWCPKPFIITIHDLILKRFPTRRASTLPVFLYWLKKISYHLVIASAIRRARKIIAVSYYTKNDILEYFRINQDKIKVVYEGSPEVQITSHTCLPARQEFQKFGISRPYLLYVGNAYPHKNLEKLILAFKKISRGRNLQLVLVGEIDYFYQRLQKEFNQLKDIIFTDFVPERDLAVLYQNASLYVFPSFCEGFGLPPLEAMACGLPVACSGLSCLPEVLGEAAIYFNPENIDDISQKINQVLENKLLQKELISKGFEKIKKYSWQKMSQEILEVYEAVV